MKICFFTQYPPTKSDTSSNAYWLARSLGEKGVEVHIVTNSLEEKFSRKEINFEDPEDLFNFQPKNVFVHSLNSFDFKEAKGERANFLQANESRLASLGIEVIRQYNCDVIDSLYFIPNAVAAFLAKKATGRPLILRHADGDLNNLMQDKMFRSLFREIFQEADLIVTRKDTSQIFQRLGIPQKRLYFDFIYQKTQKAFGHSLDEIIKVYEKLLKENRTFKKFFQEIESLIRKYLNNL